jgi:hypothetical protein
MTNLIVEAAVRASVQPFAAIAVASPVRQALRIASSLAMEPQAHAWHGRAHASHRDFLDFFC